MNKIKICALVMAGVLGFGSIGVGCYIGGQQDRYNSYSIELAEQKSDFQKIEESLANVKSQLQRKMNECNSLKSSVESMQQEKTKLIQENEQNKQEIQSKTEKINELTNQNQQKDTEIAGYQSQIETLTQEKTNAENTSAERQKTIETLQGQIASLESEKQQNLAEIERLKQEAQTSSGRISELEGEISSKDEEIRGYKSQIETLTQEKTRAEQESSEKQQTIESLQGQISSLESEKEQNQSKITELTGQVSQVQESVSEKEQKITQLQGQISTLESSVSEKEQQISTLTTQLSQAQNQYEELQQTYQELQESVSGKDLNISQLQEELSKLKSKLSQIQQSLKITPGLYSDDNVLIKSWQDLKDEKLIVVSDGALSEITAEGYLVIDSEVTSISDNAAYYKKNLTGVFIPGSVHKIGSYAFCGSGLKEVIISEGVLSIANGAFASIIPLENLVLPNSLTDIGVDAFKSSSIVELNLENVTKIDSAAFRNCLRLKKVFISKNTTFIASGAFQGSYNIQSLSVDPENPVYDSRLDCNSIIETSSNTLIQGCSVSTIPSSVVKIEANAFYGQSFTTIDIPEGVQSMGIYAFGYCFNLQKIKIPASFVGSSVSSIFGGCKSLTEVSVAEGNPVYDSRDNCNGVIKTATNELVLGLKETIIPSSVVSICSMITCGEIFIVPKSINTLAANVFYNSNLKYLYIPASVTSIPSSICSNENVKIFCEISVKPEGWGNRWDSYEGCSVQWGVSVDEFLHEVFHLSD